MQTANKQKQWWAKQLPEPSSQWDGVGWIISVKIIKPISRPAVPGDCKDHIARVYFPWFCYVFPLLSPSVFWCFYLCLWFDLTWLNWLCSLVAAALQDDDASHSTCLSFKYLSRNLLHVIISQYCKQTNVSMNLDSYSVGFCWADTFYIFTTRPNVYLYDIYIYMHACMHC